MFYGKTILNHSNVLHKIVKLVNTCFNDIKHKIPTRFYIGIMLFIGSFTSFMLRSNFSIILLSMTKQNSVSGHENDLFKWTNHEQNVLLSAYFFGYVFPNLIGGMAAERFGGRIVGSLVFILSAVLTFLSPLTASDNSSYLFFARLLLGVFGGFFFSTCHNLISHWAPPDEKGLFVSSLLGSYLGTAVTWPLTGIIVEQLGWEWAFYISGLVTMIVGFLWYFIIADCPEKHKTISKDEKNFIVKSLEVTFPTNYEFPPISKMAKSLPLHALAWLHFGDVWGAFFLLTSAPMFMMHVLKFDLKNAGYLSSLPYIARLILGFLFGIAGDIIRRRNILSVTAIRKLFCIFSHIVPGLLLISFCFIESNPYICIILISLSLGFNGASVMTSGQNCQDLAPNYAGSVFGIVNFFATTSGCISPLVVSYFTREQSTMTEWRSIFILDGAIYVLTAAFFIIYGSGEIQKWNKRDQKCLFKV